MITRRTPFRICLLGAVLLGLPAAMQAQFDYANNGGSITITHYTGAGGAVTIPATINSLPVTKIGDFAFAVTGVTSVTIPGTVTSIGTNAFYESDLTSVTIPNSVAGIGDNAFGGTGLISVTIPNSITSIATGVFGGCANLASVTIPNSVTNIGSLAFAASGLTSVTIPNSVTGIGENAFSFCKNLIGVTIPASVTSIGVGPFESCGNLKTITVNAANPGYSSVSGVLFNKSQTSLLQYPGGIAGPYTIPAGVISIANQAFGSSVLTGVTIPASVTSIGSAAFQGCGNLTGVTIPASVTSIGSQAFQSCGLTSITIPNSISNIAEDAFGACYSLTSVTLPTSVTSIGDGAFEGCDNLTSVSIPNSVISIGKGAFSVTGLTSIAIPNSVISIGDNAFSFTKLTSATIPGSVTSIGALAFGFCNLTSVTIPASVTTIGETPFLACSSLPAITVDASNPDYISGDGVLFDKNETKLLEYPDGLSGSSYTIPASVTTIAEDAFALCESLTNVMIPASVTSIGDVAFLSCSGLTGVYFQGNAPNLEGSDVFSGVAATAKVYYLAGTTGWGATYGGLPTVMLGSLGFTASGVNNNGFGFTFAGTNKAVVVEASTSLTDPDWQPILTNTFSGASFNFSDSTWRNYPCRFYRIMPVLPAPVPFTYTINGGAITVTGYTGSNGAVTIPGMIAGVPVASIGNFAFHLSSMTNVTIPNSVTNIGSDAFSDSGLTSVTIPKNVISIGDFAFYGCSGLTGAYFQGNAPALVGSGVFSGVHAGAIVYYLAGTTGWGTAYGGLPAMVVPVISASGVLNNQFGFTINGITNLVIIVEASTNLSNPSWQPIQTNTLSGTTLNFTDSQWKNYPRRFYRIVSAPPAAIQNQFTYTTNSGAITITGYNGSGGAATIPSMITGLLVTRIGADAFFDSSGLTSVTIPSSVTSIGDDAFFDASGLTSVTIPSSITSIGENVFAFCSSLTNITIANGLTTIGYGMFSGCNSLTRVTIPVTVTSIADAAFYQCQNLTGVYFQGNAPTLGGIYVFKNVNAAATVYYLSGATGWGATYGGLPTTMSGP